MDVAQPRARFHTDNTAFVYVCVHLQMLPDDLEQLRALHIEPPVDNTSDTKALFPLLLAQHEDGPFVGAIALHDKHAAAALWAHSNWSALPPSVAHVRAYFGSKLALLFGWAGKAH